MFKVKTRQTNIPLSRLQISPRKLPHLASQNSPADSVVTPERKSVKPAVSKLLPAPVLVPTAYSARHVHDSPVLSSPPTSATSSQESLPRDRATPTLPQQTSFHPPMQLHNSPEIHDRDTAEAKNAPGVVDLETDNIPSSVIKGRAATGLLQLMNMG